jgi:uncharacterized FlaG/YvyC family protein
MNIKQVVKKAQEMEREQKQYYPKLAKKAKQIDKQLDKLRSLIKDMICMV